MKGLSTMVDDKAVLESARKFALKNAIDYGKAELGSVLGKVVPLAKGTPINELKAMVSSVITEVNSMDKEELAKEYAPFESEFKAREKEIAESTAVAKITIAGAQEGNVFTRYPPEPGGYMTLGNAKQCLISDEMARLYKGKIFLYLDDTNPEKSKQEYVDGIKRDTAWLGVKFAKEYYASDYIEKEYEVCKTLISQDHAYICMCSPDQIKKNRFDKIECQHRGQKSEENLSLFSDMLVGKFEEGQAIVRLKGDMTSPDTTLRDPTIFRIKKTPHYRQGSKYTVWPTYHINTPLIDNYNGVTDVARGKEYEIFDESYKLVLKYLGLKVPRLHYMAMLQIKGGMTAHKREIRKLMKDGVLSKWDDPRLLTVMAMQRRGIQPEAIRAFVLRFGLSRSESVVPIDMLFAENRKIIDPMAKHLFFVKDPIKIIVGDSVDITVKLKLHPSKEMGVREYTTNSEFYISEEDADMVADGETIRLKDLMDVKILDRGDYQMTATRNTISKEGKIVQWVSDRNYIPCTVLVPKELFDEKGEYMEDSLETVRGFVENYAKNLKEHDIVQFERFGYCILDNEERMEFIFISK